MDEALHDQRKERRQRGRLHRRRARQERSENHRRHQELPFGDPHGVDGFAHHEKWGFPDAPSPFYQPSALSVERGRNPAWGGGLNWIASDKLFLEFKYAGWWSDDIHDSQTGSFDEPFIDYTPPGGGPETYSGGVYYPWDYVTTRNQVKAKATYYAANFLKSEHEFKMGVQYSRGLALTNVGISAAAAQMFVFYYAVLSEVSPPTALSPFAAAAITGGNPFRTTMISWKYVTPAFVVPFVFTLASTGPALLLQGSLADIAMSSAAAAVGIAALSSGVAGWIRSHANVVERTLLIGASVLLFVPQPAARLSGTAVAVAVVALHWRRTREL